MIMVGIFTLQHLVVDLHNLYLRVPVLNCIVLWVVYTVNRMCPEPEFRNVNCQMCAENCYQLPKMDYGSIANWMLLLTSRQRLKQTNSYFIILCSAFYIVFKSNQSSIWGKARVERVLIILTFHCICWVEKSPVLGKKSYKKNAA